MARQVLAWTEPSQPPIGMYVRVFQAFVLRGGPIEFRIRDENCKWSCIVLPAQEAVSEMKRAIEGIERG